MFSAMNVPSDVRYSQDHEWIRVEEGNRLRVGITDYAQDALGDVVFVELPAVGTSVEVGGVFGEVESTKSVSELFAPVAGVILEVNHDLEATPERVNEDPYGDGWICVIEPTDPAAADSLMDADAYSALLEA
ncbi:MAG: Glycine cleavage system H protein [Acidimicrobiaceae bacterium]|nr:Glycine cleavage system H protein [Acidimicrobiaceae bacterium]